MSYSEDKEILSRALDRFAQYIFWVEIFFPFAGNNEMFKCEILKYICVIEFYLFQCGMKVSF